ncbi:major facilitator superfamily domain-containing protein [Microdochium trichocladiopsis]|uniref:Major facilitator superfamily domain-containing protein n=1 Tax=Microdochium trichocladiopsis TaxID=1682393 RepID=A0A9P8Y5Y2_9PEZI|nr:major facilitator superfamily domain-containing protein [Microdochium trichocladiopsis]KAH7029023.1 major facilitator superfamily domain-containing protein [Microdochium trichocladiopsis]
MAGLFSGRPGSRPGEHDGHHNGPQHTSSSPSTTTRSAAGELLRKKSGDYGRIAVTPEDDRRVLRRVDSVLLPIMLTVYFLQVADKTTLSYSSVFGLIEDIGLEGDQYSWLGSIVYLAQLIMQFPLAWLLVRLPIAKFTSVMVLLWGTTLCLMAATHDFGSMMVARFCLGAFEATIGPSFVAITAMWWKRGEQTNRTSYWYAMNGVAGTLGSLITYGIGHIQSSLRPYQLIFLFFGFTTIAFSFIMLLYMPDSPMEAKFLDDHDRLVAIERLRVNQMGSVSREWRGDHLREAIFDLKTWLWFGLMLAISIPSGGINTFGPLIISTFGFDKFQTTLFNMPYGVIQGIAILGGSYLATKWKRKGIIIMWLCCPVIVGYTIMLALPHDASHQASLLFGYYLMSIYPGITPLLYSWSTQNTAGDTKSKCTNAILFLGQSLGNIIGPLLYSQADAPAYSRGLACNLLMFVAVILLSMVTSVHLHRLNKKHARMRVAVGKSAVIIDTSLDSPEEAATRKRDGGRVVQDEASESLMARAAEEGDGHRASRERSSERVGDHAFDDLTDLKNEEFVFVL